MNNLLLLTGFSGSGKTTIANKVSSLYNIRIISERNILRDLAVSLGFSRARYWYLSDGIHPVLEKTRIETIRRISESIANNPIGYIIIDGCYDKDLPLSIKSEINQINITTVSVLASEETRLNRVMERIRTSRESAFNEINLLDKFKTEAGIQEIINNSDLTVVNESEIMDPVRKIYNTLIKNQ
jgi:dephospho-CoA kinase